MSTEATTHITDTRRVRMAGAVDTTTWTVDEFDNGRAYMLTATSIGMALHFSAHFTGEQWAEFRGLIAGRNGQHI